MTADTTTNSRPRTWRPASIVLLCVAAAGGIYVGTRWHSTFERWLVPSASAPTADADHGATPEKKQLWTCGMHPQVIQDHPGDCPICHMKLTPLVTTAASDGPGPAATASSASNREGTIKYWWDPMMNPPYISDKPGRSPMGMDLVPVYEAHSTGAAVVIDPVIVQNMGVRIVQVSEGPLDESVRVTATIVEPEPTQHDINLRVSGWIQTLYANTDGMQVKKDDPLFDLYSPDLQLAIQELITARRAANGTSDRPGRSHSDMGASLVAAAQERLLVLGLTSEQIEAMAALERAPTVITFLSPMDGYITEKAGVYAGSSVTTGQRVFRIAQRTTMWIDGRVTERDLGRIRVGQTTRATIDAFPGRTFEGEVIFIHPHFDEMTRTGMVRMQLPNPELDLRAGMYATVEILVSDATPVVRIPREAVIDTGESQIVFISAGKGRFEPRRVVMGRSGPEGLVQILSGLKPGEQVVASGQFLLDSESRLREAIAKFLGQPTASSAPPSPAVSTITVDPVKVDAIVAAYLSLAESLGAIQTADTPLNIAPLVSAIHALHAEVSTPDGLRLITNAAAAVEAMKGQPLDTQRNLFKTASAALIALVDAMPPSASVASSLYIVNCPMAKADWLQRTQDVANPYYAEDMKACGEVVRRVGTAAGKGAR